MTNLCLVEFNCSRGVQSVLCAPPGIIVQVGAGLPEDLGLLRSSGAAVCTLAIGLGLGLGLGGWAGTVRSLGCTLGKCSNLWACGTGVTASLGVPVGIAAAGVWTTG